MTTEVRLDLHIVFVNPFSDIGLNFLFGNDFRQYQVFVSGKDKAGIFFYKFQDAVPAHLFFYGGNHNLRDFIP